MISTKRFQTLCNIAHYESKRSPMKSKLGACVVYRGKLVNVGFNSNDRSYMHGNSYTAIHAEISAITKFIQSNSNSLNNQNIRVKEDSNKLFNENNKEKNQYCKKKIDILVVRYTSDDIPAISRPCNMCIDYMRGIRGIQIKNVYYFDINGILVCEKLKDMQKIHTPKVWLTVNLDKSYTRCSGVRCVN